jgi:hypothetical protein
MAARINQAKGLKVAPHIERQAVPGNAALHAHANGADLPFTNPTAWRTVTPLRRDTVVRTRSNQRVL